MHGASRSWTSTASALAVLAALAACKDDPVQPSRASGGRDAGPSTSAAPPDSGAPVSPAFVHRDVNHVLATGQSLSVGLAGEPPLSTEQPYANLMFVTGVMAGKEGLTSFVPLVEGDTVPGTSAVVETMSSAFANLVTKMAREELLAGRPGAEASHDLLVSVHGVNATAYAGLKKGTEPYAIGMAQAKAGRDVAAKLGKSYVVRAVTTVHGESDHIDQNAAYAADLAEWQRDYEADVKALTGQAEAVPMLESQISNWTKFGQATSAIPAAQLAAHVASGGKIVLVGPKYQLAHAPDGVHLTNEGYRHMGEEYAKVYRRVVLEGRAWEPLRPKKITRTGAAITLEMIVPSPPLVLDVTLVSDPGSSGFSFVDAGGAPVPIAKVEISGADKVTVTLTSAPAGPGRLRYAHSAPEGASGGPTSGPRGNLRDSDPTRSRYGYPLYNWCVHFDEPVP